MDRAAWVVVDRQADPFGDVLPAEIDCGTSGFRLEIDPGRATESNPEGTLAEISTAACTSVTVTQPALRDIERGESLRAELFHFRLNAPAPAEAVVSVRVGTAEVLGQTLPIDVPYPSEVCPANATSGYCRTSELLESTWEVTEDIPAGTPLYFHAHNHGSNIYWLLEFDAR